MIMNLLKRNSIFCMPILFLIFISCSSTPLPTNSSVEIPKDLFGMVHAGITETPAEYQLLDEMGVTWVLNTFYWNNIEHEQGKFDFSGYDSYVDTAKKNGKKIIAVLAYGTAWLYPGKKTKQYVSPDNIPHFLRFVEEIVLHYKGKVDVWNIWNEANFMFWDGSNKDFYELSKRTAQKIKEVDPNAFMIGGIFWRAPRGFIKGMHKAGAMENLDALAFHPYALNPTGSMMVYDKFTKILSEINYNGPVWITEIGYPTEGVILMKAPMKELPAYVVKTITGAAARGPKVLLWYELFDGYNEGEMPKKGVSVIKKTEITYGLAYRNYKRKNGAWAFELCARFLPGSRYVPGYIQTENIPSSIVSFCFLEGASGNNTLILWNDKKKLQKVNLHISTPAFLYDISTGNSQPIQEETVLDIGDNPHIITWQGKTVPRLSRSK